MTTARAARVTRVTRAARSARVALAVPLALAVAVLPACGGDSNVRGWLTDSYRRTDTRGDTESYLSTEPVDRTAAAIAAGVAPAARASDGGSQYLRFADDIVIVSAAAAGAGSTVRVEDLDDGFSRGQYARLGSGFTPGSPAGKDGGPGDGK
ncbi:DUF4247 domain-containing protein [Frankia sp. Mgl5]|uniref:DUF4247 domain-containing protein n=1 Tax=Frankia sp. Mgl5 TaxID=2933793 RepID=UPI00200EFE48|nr:DUF4247 domain-containing protein [Frankia sp. Mgl5]MCK9928906.1 DUF4247 domain-containing protein [Frankia sp. Mgl5]